jgi:hypothetical protein
MYGSPLRTPVIEEKIEPLGSDGKGWNSSKWQPAGLQHDLHEAVLEQLLVVTFDDERVCDALGGDFQRSSFCYPL